MALGSSDERCVDCDKHGHRRCESRQPVFTGADDFDDAVVGIGELPPAHECPTPGEWCAACRAQMQAHGFTVPEPLEMPVDREATRRMVEMLGVHAALKEFAEQRARRVIAQLERDDVAGSHFAYVRGGR